MRDDLLMRAAENRLTICFYRYCVKVKDEEGHVLAMEDTAHRPHSYALEAAEIAIQQALGNKK